MPDAPPFGASTKKFPEEVTVTRIVTGVLPSLIETEYVPEAGAVPLPDSAWITIAPFASVVMSAAVKVVHPAGTPAEPVTVSNVFGFMPLTDRRAYTVVVPVGAYATPESIPTFPKV